MMTIRDILKFFSLDVCAKLDIIETYKENQKEIRSFPLSLKIACMISIFIITLSLFIALFTLSVELGYSLKWLSFVGVAFIGLAFIIRNSSFFLAQYSSLLFLILGFTGFCLGFDQWGGETLLGLAGGGLVLLICTYNMFHKDIYRAFASFIILSLSTLYIGQVDVYYLQFWLLGLSFLMLFLALFPIRFFNLYIVVKTLLAFLCLVLLLLSNDSGSIVYTDWLTKVMAGMVIALGGIACIYRSKDKIVQIVIVSIFGFALSCMTSFVVGFAWVVMLLGYTLSSVRMFVFGVVYYVLVLCLFFFNNPDISLEYKSGMLLFVAVGHLVSAFAFKEKKYVSK